jgi:NAD+ kinase
MWFNAKMKATFKRVGIIGKYGSQDLLQPLEHLLAFLRSRALEIYLDERTAQALHLQSVPALPLKRMVETVDLVVVLGGDGTLLSAARDLATHKVPIIGINLGKLGFLTDIPANAMDKSLGEVLDGHYSEETRTMLETSIQRQERVVNKTLALNDLVISKGSRGSMIELAVFVDGQFVYDMRADGLIVATPTGSTAYALSSGGPILHPGLGAIVLAPICPHTLSNRPIALSTRSRVEIVLQKGEDAIANFDVQTHFPLNQGDRLVITPHENGIRLLHPSDYSYYSMLREKLHWGARL